MNLSMWRKALTVIPNITKAEWDQLDTISRWLISTRAAVLVMTALSAALAGLFAWRDNSFALLPWIALMLGLVLAHASNNLLNDYVDFARGVDQKNYFRAMYGPHPLKDQLLGKRQHLTYFGITVLLAFACGLYLMYHNGHDPQGWFLLGAGAFLLLFYTWPLKYIALGEIAVFLVWGPLMVGGGYFVLTGHWSAEVMLVGVIYAFGVTTVIFGKHIDKITVDKEKRIHTLPVLLGEKLSRYTVIGMMIIPYFLVLYLIIAKGFSPALLVTVLAIPRLRQIMTAFLQPKPKERPEGFPDGQGGWPLYFAPLAFVYNRTFGSLFFLGLLADVILKKLLT
ncbi:MAG: prenyltransferase [Anaerolineae bacterium]|nr:MAG: prenyltransferase [Anaerolineae bacterium]WKZ43068.1 MAG: prenyltransferase [Anaerolineales bacterium]